MTPYWNPRFISNLQRLPDKQKYDFFFQPFVYLKLVERQSVTALPAMSKKNSSTGL